jgi:hypothetical protein
MTTASFENVLCELALGKISHNVHLAAHEASFEPKRHLVVAREFN